MARSPIRSRSVVLLTGGLGGARLAPALLRRLGPGRLTVVANVGDDFTWLGLRVCPDLDSVLYALAGVWDAERGWGRRDETFVVRGELGRLGAETWFGIGDRDLAHHLTRTDALRAATLSETTASRTRALGIVGVDLLPASDEPSETTLRLGDGRVLHFQEWYVRERAEPEVREVVLRGGRAAPGALRALAAADAVILGPSSPLASIAPMLALVGMTEAVARVPRRIAVSPLVARVPPASASAEHHARARARLLAAEGRAHTPAAIADRYRGLAERFLVDPADADALPAVRASGLEPVTAPLLDPHALADAIARIVEDG